MELNGLNTANELKVLTAILEKAEEIGYQINDYTHAGYNDRSGFFWIHSEDEMYTLCIADYAYHRGEPVQCLFTEPFEGEEFFGDTFEECIKDYKAWAYERLKDGDICESDILEF